MNRNVIKLPSKNLSFYSFEKDIEKIVDKLFNNENYSNDLKRLLVINERDCLDNRTSEVYNKVLKNLTVKDLFKNGYVTIVPKIALAEHEEVKSYLIITMNDFTLNDMNPEFRDCTIQFDIICNLDYWDLGDYRLRPLKIAGIIDSLLNKQKLSGIGTLVFMGCGQIQLDENLAGYSLFYRAIHMTDGDDIIPPVGE